MSLTSDRDEQKANIASLYNSVAPLYGQVGPDTFAYAGRQLVERMDIVAGTQVLDVGVGRGANLFPAAEKVGPQGQVWHSLFTGTHVSRSSDAVQNGSLRQTARGAEA